VSTLLGLPVVVASALLPVAVGARRDTQARPTALQAIFHARLPVRRRRAPVRAPRPAIYTHIAESSLYVRYVLLSKHCKDASKWY
jgi:hypothetical protein